VPSWVLTPLAFHSQAGLSVRAIQLDMDHPEIASEEVNGSAKIWGAFLGKPGSSRVGMQQELELVVLDAKDLKREGRK